VIVKFWEPPDKTVAEVGFHDVVVTRFDVREKFLFVALPLGFETEMPVNVCD
jgi:hypothetical protein